MLFLTIEEESKNRLKEILTVSNIMKKTVKEEKKKKK